MGVEITQTAVSDGRAPAVVQKAAAVFPGQRLRRSMSGIGGGIANISRWKPGPRGQRVFWHLSWILLVAAGIILVYGLVSAVSYTLTHPTLPCPDPPSRESWPPQWAVVVVCLATFVLGHLTSRYQPTMSARAKSKGLDVPPGPGTDADLEDPLPTPEKATLDSKRFRQERTRATSDLHRTGRTALVVQALLLVFLLEVAALLIIEAVTLSRNVWPITYYVRCTYDAAGPWSMAAAAAILFLVGRWFWLPSREE